MRIISGSMRGTKLFTLEGIDTRPTLDRVKESLFNIIYLKLDDAVVLDLFSGSGALALESLSRGAKQAVVCDCSSKAIRIIKQNIEKTKTQEKIMLFHCDYENAITQIAKRNMQFDIIFLDPPYASDFAEKALQKIIEMNILHENGIIILETDDKEKVIENIHAEVFDIFDTRKYGRVFLLFLRRKG